MPDATSRSADFGGGRGLEEVRAVVEGGVEMAEQATGTCAFATDLRGLRFAEGDDTASIEVCRDGRWNHPSYGVVVIDGATRERFARNFATDVRRMRELPLDYDHQQGPAPGWIVGLRNEGSSLFAEVRFTSAGREKVQSGEYRFFSPEWSKDYVDPETAAHHGPTLIGGALTNKPFFKGMAAIQCSEPGLEVAATDGGGSERFAEVEERLRAVEAENRRLTAAETRRALSQQFSEVRISLGDPQFSRSLAPAFRERLVELALELPAELRQRFCETVAELALVETGERGFTAAEPGTRGMKMDPERKRKLMAATPIGKGALKSVVGCGGSAQRV